MRLFLTVTFSQEIPINNLPTEILIPDLEPNTTYEISLIPKHGNTTGLPTVKLVTTGMTKCFVISTFFSFIKIAS